MCKAESVRHHQLDRIKSNEEKSENQNIWTANTHKRNGRSGANKEYLTNGGTLCEKLRKRMRRFEGWRVEEGILKFGTKRVFAEDDERGIEEFILSVHNGNTAHQHYRTTFDMISKLAVGIRRKVVQLVLKKCSICSEFNSKREVKRESKPIKTEFPCALYEADLIDLSKMTPKKVDYHGFPFILTCVDHYSKFGCALALPNKFASTVMKELITIFRRIGPPLQLQVDYGSEFLEILEPVIKDLFNTKMRRLKHDPNQNGAIERFNQTVETFLGKIIRQNKELPSNWPNYLEECVYYYNNNTVDPLAMAPCTVFMGRLFYPQMDLYENMIDIRKSADIALKANRRKIRNKLNKTKRKAFTIGDPVYTTIPKGSRHKFGSRHVVQGKIASFNDEKSILTLEDGSVVAKKKVKLNK